MFGEKTCREWKWNSDTKNKLIYHRRAVQNTTLNFNQKNAAAKKTAKTEQTRKFSVNFRQTPIDIIEVLLANNIQQLKQHKPIKHDEATQKDFLYIL